MRFLGRAVLMCALAAPGAAWVPGPAAATAAETFAAPATIGGAATTAIGTLLREPGVGTGLRDVRLLDAFYRALGYRPAWQGQSGWTEDAHRVVRRLRDAGTHGLDAADYASDALNNMLAAAPSRAGAARDDIALTVAMLRFLDHASNGRIKPSLAGWKVWFHPRSAFAVEAATAVAGGRIADYLDRAGPPDARYAALRRERARYAELAADASYPLLGDSPTLRPGDTDPAVGVVRRQLAIFGDLPSAPSVVGHAPRDGGQWRQPQFLLASAETGASVGGDEDLIYFGESLEQGVQAFQRRHGLAVDGVVGPATRRALDKTPADRLRQIDLGLERLRWLPAQRGTRHVIVNIPAAELTAFENGVERLRMPVVTGQADWETPVFSDEIVNLKFAPTWTIPYNIVRDETLAHVRRDPGYLTANKIRVLWRGEEVDPWTVDWHSAGPGDFTFRQDSGPSSALGGVRFSLTNDFGIYLHDTPSKRYFGRAARALSHGCVRVGDPVALAEFLLAPQGEWDAQRIRAEMNGSRERFQNVRPPVPVHMVYITAWAEDGPVQFRNDVYGLDRKLAELLDARTRGRSS